MGRLLLLLLLVVLREEVERLLLDLPCWWWWWWEAEEEEEVEELVEEEEVGGGGDREAERERERPRSLALSFSFSTSKADTFLLEGGFWGGTGAAPPAPAAAVEDGRPAPMRDVSEVPGEVSGEVRESELVPTGLPPPAPPAGAGNILVCVCVSPFESVCVCMG